MWKSTMSARDTPCNRRSTDVIGEVSQDDEHVRDAVATHERLGPNVLDGVADQAPALIGVVTSLGDCDALRRSILASHVDRLAHVPRHVVTDTATADQPLHVLLRGQGPEPRGVDRVALGNQIGAPEHEADRFGESAALAAARLAALEVRERRPRPRPCSQSGRPRSRRPARRQGVLVRDRGFLHAIHSL